ncbi:MAG TPA: sigma-70 family RNA polymerase sigma factor [Acidimicrobiia bacterium]|nr:sigma-70 family RNA polymerase sigma factor [Acidimicrobiia bacterium]
MAEPERTASSRFTFPAAVGAASAAREALASLGRLDPIRLAEAQLLVSELIANALQHAGLDEADRICMTVETGTTGVTIAIVHRAPLDPDLSARGVGLTLVEHIARRWGASQCGDGTFEVWFEVRAPGTHETISHLSDEEMLQRVRGDAACRDEAIKRFRDLATGLAGRFRGKGVSDEDLEQVALVGLLSALSRYEPETGPFRPYAIATIQGALKRQLRDRAWSVRVPRGLQELSLEVARTAESLAQRLARTVTPADIAAELGLDEGEVLEGIAAGTAYQTESIDAPNERTGANLADSLHDATWAQQLDDWRELAEVIRSLPVAEQRLLYLRFYRDLTQTEIAEELGISQMHVSRLLSKTLARLRNLAE